MYLEHSFTLILPLPLPSPAPNARNISCHNSPPVPSKFILDLLSTANWILSENTENKGAVIFWMSRWDNGHFTEQRIVGRPLTLEVGHRMTMGHWGPNDEDTTLRTGDVEDKIVLKISTKSKYAKLSKVSKIVERYWIYDANTWGMNVFIEYMLPP